MINRTHAAAAFLTAGLAVGATSMVVAQDATPPSSTDLYKKGVELLQAGATKDAKETLSRVDPLQLPEGDRAAYFAALKQAEGGAPAPVTAAPADKAPSAAQNFLNDGDKQYRLGDFAAARAAYTQGLTAAGDDAVHQTLQARLADVARQTKGQPAPTVPQAGPATGDALTDARGGTQAELVAAGDDAMAKKLYAQAVASYTKARDLAPEDAGIAGKLAAAQSAQSSHSNTGLAADLRMFEVEHTKALTLFAAAMEDARKHLEAHNYVGANGMVNIARAQSNQSREWLSVSEYEDMQAQASALGVSIDAAETADRLQAEQAKDHQANGGAAEAAAADKAARVNQLLTTARALQRNGQYPQALVAAEQAAAIDPQNMAAQMLTDMLRDIVALTTSDQLLKSKANHTAMLAHESREAVIPYTDLLTYPTDWPRLSERRQAAASGANMESDVDRNTRHLLDEKIIENSAFNGDSLETALNFVRDATGANMVVLWGSIELVGIRRDTTVTQPLKHVSAAQLLKVILDNVSTQQEGENRLAYAIEGGIIKVATRKELKNTTSENIYDIRDLLVQVPNFDDAPSFSLDKALKGSSGGASSTNIFDTAATPAAAIDPNAVVDELVTRIKEHVGTRSEWDDNLSVISAYHGQLLVKTTPENHRALAKLLENFRQTRSVQIAVESRFLVVQNDFLEEFGLDLDMAFAGNHGLSPITVRQGSAPTQNAGGNGMATRPTNSLTPNAFKSADTSGSNPQALSLGASYLSDLQVDLLVTATQAKQTGITLTAPRLTFFNGQRAYVVVGRQVAFISDLTPIPNTNASKSTVSTVQEGVVLDVEGTTSADRRYVTLTLRPSLARLQTPIRQIEQRAANTVIAGGAAQAAGQLGGLTGATTGTDSQQGTLLGVIEAPELELTSIRTTVSIPDRGTLMTGGQRLINETQVEVGVPVLSKIPILDRLFTNTSQVKDERTLLILIKPTIILQNEEEERRWPGGPGDWSAYNANALPQQYR